jgi:YspA, cpYpsA-related SLOG family
MNVVVTGSRDWPEEDTWLIEAALDWYYSNDGEFGNLYVGGNPHGVDLIAKRWAEKPTRVNDDTFEYHEFPADWKTHGKWAGPLRNREMLKAAGSGLVLAFHASPDHYLNLNRQREGKSGQTGTNHCANTAKELGSFQVYHTIRDA